MKSKISFLRPCTTPEKHVVSQSTNRKRKNETESLVCQFMYSTPPSNNQIKTITPSPTSIRASKVQAVTQISKHLHCVFDFNQKPTDKKLHSRLLWRRKNGWNASIVTLTLQDKYVAFPNLSIFYFYNIIYLYSSVSI